MSEGHRVVVKHKHGGDHDDHHGGSWKIAYADFMTAMMSFFLVMWLLSLVPKNELQGVAEYFKKPLLSAIKGDPHSSTNRNVIPGGSPTPIPNKSNQSANPKIQDKQEIDRDRAERLERERLDDIKRRLEKLIQNSPTLRRFARQLILDMTPEGLRVQVIDNKNRPMFATGSARLTPEMESVLREIAPALNSMPNGVSISGHTDASQYSTGDQYYSNWELSAERANAARQKLVSGGIADQKVRRVMGLSSTMPFVKDDPLDATNRRITIVLLNRRAEQVIGATYGPIEAKAIDVTNSAEKGQLSPPQDQDREGTKK